jgi:Protein of unknown function (DUF2934)
MRKSQIFPEARAKISDVRHRQQSIRAIGPTPVLRNEKEVADLALLEMTLDQFNALLSDCITLQGALKDYLRDAIVISTRRIRERAYDIWTREGCQHGREMEYWLRAKAELLAEHSRVPQ